MVNSKQIEKPLIFVSDKVNNNEKSEYIAEDTIGSISPE